MYAFFIGLINNLIAGLGAVLNAIFSLLPPSPFTALDNSPIASYLPTINYFVPVSQIITISEVWLTGISAYYIYQIVLRWLKAIR